MPTSPNIVFLNVDLDIESRCPLTPLINALGDHVIVLHQLATSQVFSASLETPDPADGADATINTLCSLIESLPEDARQSWHACTTRVFNIGYQGGYHPRGEFTFQSLLHPATIARIAHLGAGVAVTIYPVLE